jgi:ribosomal protein S18 acetylase RimI-like enzyme
MATTYYKRLNMEIDVQRQYLPEATLPEGYAWAAWHPVLAEPHARVKYESFLGELDSDVFASLSTLDGCRRLVKDIFHHSAFVPKATWLIRFEGNEFAGPSPCGTIQGLRRNWRLGSIQNVGIVPVHRGFGLGRALVLKCLAGFRETGVRRVQLEVTADNHLAVELYRSIGFSVRRTSYRSVTRDETLVPA